MLKSRLYLQVIEQKTNFAMKYFIHKNADYTKPNYALSEVMNSI